MDRVDCVEDVVAQPLRLSTTECERKIACFTSNIMPVGLWFVWHVKYMWTYILWCDAVTQRTATLPDWPEKEQKTKWSQIFYLALVILLFHAIFSLSQFYCVRPSLAARRSLRVIVFNESFSSNRYPLMQSHSSSASFSSRFLCSSHSLALVAIGSGSGSLRSNIIIIIIIIIVMVWIMCVLDCSIAAVANAI